jgi:hypothetical protein
MSDPVSLIATVLSPHVIPLAVCINAVFTSYSTSQLIEECCRSSNPKLSVFVLCVRTPNFHSKFILPYFFTHLACPTRGGKNTCLARHSLYPAPRSFERPTLSFSLTLLDLAAPGLSTSFPPSTFSWMLNRNHLIYIAVQQRICLAATHIGR